jgi:hypothetical protein
MDESQETVRPDAGDDSEALQALRQLAVSSPQDSLQRFRRRATVVQGTRMLFESQITGFWIVLDAFLRMALGGKDTQLKAADSQGDEA